ncbi:MAG TPA: RNA-binding domain-containing protein [Thermoplasmata archaeon]|jgi:predicted RNA binding protein with dsRBD fold (UPF0201 family)
MLEIRLRADCHPTEDRDKMIRSIKRLFPDSEISGESVVSGVSRSVDEFGELLKRQHIRDAARAVMRRNMRGNTTAFRLNKQVAAVGKISFSEESHPLGDIEVEITSDSLESVIDSIAPSTRAEGIR